MNKGTLIITGASKGIGYTTATLFLQQGWRVINISRSACALAGVKNFNIDLSTVDWTVNHSQKLIAAVANSHKIILVHNAALYFGDTIATIMAEELRRMLEVNIIAAAELNKLFLPHMAAGSAIIYIGSTLSEKAVAGAASYIISKHATVGMMRATCQDLFSTPNVHTCCICPGFTETEMVREHLKNNTALADAAKNRVSARRLVQPAEVASLIHYCAENPVVNGAVLHANLGQKEE